MTYNILALRLNRVCFRDTSQREGNEKGNRERRGGMYIYLRAWRACTNSYELILYLLPLLLLLHTSKQGIYLMYSFLIEIHVLLGLTLKAFCTGSS
jgi:hypothetical protein